MSVAPKLFCEMSIVFLLLFWIEQVKTAPGSSLHWGEHWDETRQKYFSCDSYCKGDFNFIIPDDCRRFCHHSNTDFLCDWGKYWDETPETCLSCKIYCKDDFNDIMPDDCTRFCHHGNTDSLCDWGKHWDETRETCLSCEIYCKGYYKQIMPDSCRGFCHHSNTGLSSTTTISHVAELFCLSLAVVLFIHMRQYF